jgi:hypothetical protein
MNFKITPLILFIILLLILFLSIVFVNKFNLEEGFISYQKDEYITFNGKSTIEYSKM